MDKILLFLSIIISLIGGLGAKSLHPKTSRPKLVIDHDGGADDAMAIFMCLLYEKYFDGPEVVALTTTHGNVNESQVFVNSQRFLDMTHRRDVPIYRGSSNSLVISFESDFYFGHDGLGDNDDLDAFEAIEAQAIHAVLGLIELSKKYEGELIVMAIGPQTNIALAQKLDPGFIGRLGHLYVGAGNIHNEASQEPEFNAQMDVEAFRIVTDSATSDKVTLVPFSQIMISLNLTTKWREDVLGAISTKIMQSLNKFERISIVTSESWSLLDPAVAAIVLDGNTVEEFKYSNSSIHLCGSDRSINTHKLHAEDSNVRLVYSAKEEYYKKLLIDIFSAELKYC